jgi:hypothetical protein
VRLVCERFEIYPCCDALFDHGVYVTEVCMHPLTHTGHASHFLCLTGHPHCLYAIPEGKQQRGCPSLRRVPVKQRPKDVPSSCSRVLGESERNNWRVNAYNVTAAHANSGKVHATISVSAIYDFSIIR